MLIRILYTLLLTLAAPVLLYGLYKRKSGKPAFGARWKEHFGSTPALQGRNPIWIHDFDFDWIVTTIVGGSFHSIASG